MWNGAEVHEIVGNDVELHDIVVEFTTLPAVIGMESDF